MSSTLSVACPTVVGTAPETEPHMPQASEKSSPIMEISFRTFGPVLISVAAFTGRGSCIPYCASKGALVTMTKSLARVLGPKGVRVNAVAPGFIKGDWLHRGVGENYDSFVAEKEAEAPLQTSCSPEDVADAILGLITGSDLVTGESLTVDAGHTLGGGW